MPSGGLEGVGVRVAQPHGPRRCAPRAELGELEHDDGSRGLALVAPSAGLDDRELDLRGPVHAIRPRATGQLERAIWSATAPLAVGLDRDVGVGPGDPAVGTELGQGCVPPPGGVRGQPGRLPDHGEPGRATDRSLGVLVRAFGILVDQTSGHDDVPADDVLQCRGQAGQLGPNNPIEIVGGD